MKNFFKVFTLGLLLTLFTAVGVTSTFAQDTQAEKKALYQKYLDNYEGSIPQRKVAIAAAKEYIQKFNEPIDEAQVTYFKSAIPQLEKGINDQAKAAAAAEAAAATAATKGKLYKDFDTAARASNWDQVYGLGKQILADDPTLIDVVLVLGSIGLDESYKTPSVKKYNDDTITYAKLAIDKLNNGAISKNFGAYSKYEYKNKENALGWMNWTIGNLLYYQMDKEQEALPYLYKASQLNSEVKENSEIYRAIGRWYLNKLADMEKVRLARLTAANNVDTPETLALLTQNKAYAARAIDAYSRAYKYAKANPKTTKVYNDNLFGKLKDLYKFRYDEDAMKTDAKINSDVALITTRPMPNPNTPIESVETAKPDAETTETTDASKTDTDKKPMPAGNKKPTPVGNNKKPVTTGAQRNRTVKDNKKPIN